MIKGYFILLTSLLTANLTSPDAIYGGQISKHQDLKKAEHIIKILKNQNQLFLLLFPPKGGINVFDKPL